MKLITKLQSYTDVITNSSSTVFLMHKEDAEFYEKDTPGDCCSIQLIDEEWVRNNHWEWQLIFDYLDIPYEEVAIKRSCEKCYWRPEGFYWEGPDDELWGIWVNNNIERLKKDLFGLYFVDIEDHFADSYEYINNAGDDALIIDYRH